MLCLLHRTDHPDHDVHGVATSCCWSRRRWCSNWRSQCSCADGVPSLVLDIGLKLTLFGQYQAETAPHQLRGTLTATYQLFITAGILAACMHCFCSNCAIHHRLISIQRFYCFRNSRHGRHGFLEAPHRSRIRLGGNSCCRYTYNARISSVRPALSLSRL